MPKGSARRAVGSGPKVMPQDWNSQVTMITMAVPKAMVSPWAKFEKRSTPKISVTPKAPSASWLP